MFRCMMSTMNSIIKEFVKIKDQRISDFRIVLTATLAGLKKAAISFISIITLRFSSVHSVFFCFPILQLLMTSSLGASGTGSGASASSGSAAASPSGIGAGNGGGNGAGSAAVTPQTPGGSSGALGACCETPGDWNGLCLRILGASFPLRHAGRLLYWRLHGGSTRLTAKGPRVLVGNYE